MYKIEGNFIYLEGVLDNNLFNVFNDKSWDKNELYFIDMSKVEDITYVGMHILLNEYNNNHKFMLVKCNEFIFIKLYNVGVGNFITIIKEPKKIDIKKYKSFGEGYWGESYRNEDETEMLKVYKRGDEIVKNREIYREKSASLALMRMHLISPLSGELVDTEEGPGILYENLKNKISYSRLIERDADNDDNLKIHAKNVAKLIKKLHSTKCDTSVFKSAKEFYKIYIEKANGVTDEQRKKLYMLLDEIEDADTCIHGDFNPGNIVNVNGEDMMIDLPEFSYGSPLFDLATLYPICNYQNENFSMAVFHNKVETLKKFWSFFIEAYMGTNDKKAIEDMTNKLKKICCLRIARFTMDDGPRPDLLKVINNNL